MEKQTTLQAAYLPILGRILTKIITQGNLTVIDSQGNASHFGAAHTEPSVTVRLLDRWLPLKIAINPSLATGEAYMNGRLTIIKGDLRSFLLVVTASLEPLYSNAFMRSCNRMAITIRGMMGGNRRRCSVRNAVHHYDLSADFYRLFLDRNMHYSCAYFETGSETLEEAQAAKARHIAAKLFLKPKQRILDIGSGWGSMALMLARETGVTVKGVTLSTAQLKTARDRAAKLRLSNRVEFALQDYRDVVGQFDRIVSIGMLEHVGRLHLGSYFGKINELLAPDGVALVHSIGRWDANTGPDPWTDRYIFPGGHIPSLSEVIPSIEASGLLVTDIEILRLHYAETLRHWSDRFAARRETALTFYNEKFCRMWEFYLAAAEISFRNRPLMVFQIQLAHKRDAVPLTRNYIDIAEDQLAQKSSIGIREVA
jgi:cyclopropane-fatty-acyl-phospholipid synthase